MRRRLLGLVVLAALAACSDSSPTGTRSPGVLHPRSSASVTNTSLNDEINNFIALWPKGLAQSLTSQWNMIKAKAAAGQLDLANKKLSELAAYIFNKEPNIGNPTPNTPDGVASKLILDMILYINGGDPGADEAFGILEPDQPLTLVTQPQGNAGVHFDAGSVHERRLIVVRPNPTFFPDLCSGPLDTTLCQYPLFYFIESYPDGALLKTAQAEVCHLPVNTDTGPGYRGPTDEGTHGRFHLAHPKPDKPANYVPGGVIMGNIEILPVITQTFIPTCPEGIDYFNPELTLVQRGIHLASTLGSKVWHVFGPESAYAIDQGGGGSFDDFGSPFNAVDVPAPPPPPEAAPRR